MSSHSSPFPACFRPSTTTDPHHSLPPPPPPPPPISGHPNLTTCLYHTHLAVFSLTWSRSFLSRSLHLHLHPPFDSLSPPPSLSSSPSFHLQIKPFLFWKKHGSKKLSSNFHIYWDLSRAKFGSGPEPLSGFYIAVLVDRQMTLLVGDLVKEAYARTKALKPQNTPQSLVLKREHVIAPKIYTTKVRLGGKIRDVQIDCGYKDNTRLCFSVDNKTVLKIKRLKWKFRGNERIEVDGVGIQISWDVHNWIFEDEKEDGHAVFMFRFEEDEETDQVVVKGDQKSNGVAALWPQPQNWNVGMNGIERRKMRKSFSFSSVSMSSAGSSGGSSSVMEWASMEESELSGGPSGFSLLVYAWKR